MKIKLEEFLGITVKDIEAIQKDVGYTKQSVVRIRSRGFIEVDLNSPDENGGSTVNYYEIREDELQCVEDLIKKLEKMKYNQPCELCCKPSQHKHHENLFR